MRAHCEGCEYVQGRAALSAAFREIAQVSRREKYLICGCPDGGTCPARKIALLALYLRGKDKPESETNLIQRYRLEFYEWIANTAIETNRTTIEKIANNRAKEIISTAHKQAAKKGGDAKAAKLKDPKENIRKAWASGNYTSRDICAEQEYSSLGFKSFKAARNALKGTPPPNPWPAKVKKKN